jgi:hypothetical protein
MESVGPLMGVSGLELWPAGRRFGDGPKWLGSP